MIFIHAQKVYVVCFGLFLFLETEKRRGGSGERRWAGAHRGWEGDIRVPETSTMWQVGVLTWKPGTFCPFCGCSGVWSHRQLEPPFTL